MNKEKPSADSLNETTISTKSIFTGRVISLQVDTVQLPDGNQAEREIVRHPGAVAVLAEYNGKLLLVDQYRQAMGRRELEIPAGKLEKGEEPLEAAKRELEEETGYRAGKMTHLHSFYTSPGFADEIIHLFAATELTPGSIALDEDEFLEVHEVTLAEAQQHISEGWIADAKTLLAVYMWQMKLHQGK